MAYNLESLVQILEQMLISEDEHRRPWILDPSERSYIESLLAKARFLKDFFVNSSPRTGHQVQILETRIRDAAYHAENIIASHLADKFISKKKGESLRVSPPTDLLQVIEEYEFERALDKMVEIMDGSEMTGDDSSSSLVSRTQDMNPNNVVVGITDDLIQLKDRVNDPKSKLEIIPIVGMGGIGKTTLAHTLYDDLSLVSYFDTRAWIAVSQVYNVRVILIRILQCFLGKLTDVINREEDDKLALRVHQFLCGRRFLIVLDDMWNSELWDDIKMFFPDETNGSRILVTTRELSVANYVGTQNFHHHMNFLNEADSWNLLSKRVFAEQSCLQELEEVGKNIAKDCRGLPLALHVVGGVLSRSARTHESWAQVAKDVSSSLADDKDEQFFNILSLSYLHLPNYLKPCFLYMSAFPEDYEIRPSKLIKLWVAEGFLKPISGKSLEEAAEVYLWELVERNLLSVRQWETKRNVTSYIMHDLLRDLSIRKAREEKFLYVVMDAIREYNPKDTLQFRRLSLHRASPSHTRFITGSVDLARVTHSVLLFGSYAILDYSHNRDFPPLDVFAMRLLRVLDILTVELPWWPNQVEKLVNLRYLAALFWDSNVPSSISNLFNLQTLIFRQGEDGPHLVPKTRELFDMPQLRHIKFKGKYPFYHVGDGESVPLQENLQTLSTVAIDNTFPKIVEAMPNLKYLGIFEDKDFSISCIIDLTCLSKLDALKCIGDPGMFPKASSLISFLVFPPSLRRLTLQACTIPQRYMETIGALPNLEILKLQGCDFESQTWEPTQGEFCQLRLLVFQSVDLVRWMADETHYPRLERLVIRDCSQLEEIPCEIGDILTLEIIEVVGASTASVLKSAKNIQEEQNEIGNDALQLRINAYVEE